MAYSGGPVRHRRAHRPRQPARPRRDHRRRHVRRRHPAHAAVPDPALPAPRSSTALARRRASSCSRSRGCAGASSATSFTDLARRRLARRRGDRARSAPRSARPPERLLGLGLGLVAARPRRPARRSASARRRSSSASSTSALGLDAASASALRVGVLGLGSSSASSRLEPSPPAPRRSRPASALLGEACVLKTSGVVDELEVDHLGARRPGAGRASRSASSRPGRSAKRGPTSANSLCTTSFERRKATAWRRAWMSPRRPSVIICSAIGLTAFAFVTVVLMRRARSARRPGSRRAPCGGPSRGRASCLCAGGARRL